MVQQKGQAIKWPMAILRSLLLGLAAMTRPSYSQFTSTVDCPSDSTIRGYDNIAALNTDMQTELDRISNGGQPAASYSVTLCPDTTFDASGGALIPLLDNLSITCGLTGTSDQNCIFSGGNQHIQVRDSGVPNYPINNVNIAGVTFGQFTGASFAGRATSRNTRAVLRNCIWQDFSGNQLVSIRAGSGTPMAVVVENSVIRSTSGNPDDARATYAFRNQGGSIVVNGVTVENARFDNVATVTDSGETLLTDLTVSGSVVQRVVQLSSGTVDVEGMNVTNNSGFNTVFDVSNSVITINATVVEGNIQASDFRILSVRNGGSATFTESEISGNIQLEHAIHVQAGSSAVIEQSSFLSNNGTENNAFVLSEGDGAFVNMTRNFFYNNSGALANIAAFFGGDVSFFRHCFDDNDNFMVALVLEESNFTAGNNFVGANEVSEICGGVDEDEGDGRLAIEIPGSLCFRGGDRCRVDCEPQANDSPVCLAQVFPSVPPSEMPTNTPSPSTSQSPSTSMLPSTSDAPSLSNGPTAEVRVTPAPSLSFLPSSSQNPSLSLSPSGSASPTISSPPTLTLRPTTSTIPSTSVTPSTSISPTMTSRPTVSFLPSTSVSPTLISQPTLTPGPTTSTTPSASLAPSTSTLPTISSQPTLTASPTTSFAPSASQAPSLSSRPSNSPAPTLTARPTLSLNPTLSLRPSTSSAPTISSQPTMIPVVTPNPTSQQTIFRPTTMLPSSFAGFGLWPFPFAYSPPSSNYFPPQGTPLGRPPSIRPPGQRPTSQPPGRPPMDRPPQIQGPSGRPPGRPLVYRPPYDSKKKSKGKNYYKAVKKKKKGGGSKTSKGHGGKDYSKGKKKVYSGGKGKGKGGAKNDSGDFHFGRGYVQPRTSMGSGLMGTKWFGRRFGGEETDN